MAASALEELIQSLRCLPGVGQRSAQRMAYHLLQRDRKGAVRLGEALASSLANLRHCERCNTFSELEVCERCANPKRDAARLCVVETPADLAMIEQTQTYDGRYYVLMGRLSPLDGIGPRELGLDRLISRVSDGEVKEVILATNFTNDGEITAHTIAALLNPRGLKVTRLSSGLPSGGELEHSDIGTIAQALAGRRGV